MKTVRLLLLLVAGAILFLVAMILRREAERTPESVLAQARALVEQEAPNFNGALLTIEQGLRSLEDEEDTLALAPLALERMRIYRMRWDLSLQDAKVAHEPGDLRQILSEAQEFITRYDPRNSKALFLGASAALEMQRFQEAQELAELLLESSADALVRAQAHRSLGTISVSLGDRKLRELVASQGELSPEEFASQLRRAQHMALLHASNPRDEALFDRYKNVLSLELAEQAAQSVGAASSDYARGVDHFLEALAVYPDEASVLGLQQLSLRSGEFDDVIDMGLMALSRKLLSPSTAILSLTLQALQATSRTEQAIQLLRERMRLIRQVPLDYRLLNDAELNDFCQLLLELGDMRAMQDAANELKNRPPGLNSKVDYKRFGYFYTLLARVAFENMTSIKTIIQKAEPQGESYEGQWMEYWAAAADSSRMRERGPEAQRYLAKAIEFAPLDPKDPRMRRVTGEMWSQLGQNLLAAGNAPAAETPIAHALRLLPEKREELMESYAVAGEAHMRSKGRWPNQLRARPTLVNEQGVYPEMGPFEACFRVRRCLELGQPTQAGVLLGPLLNRFPGFPMALELLAEAALDRKETRVAIEHLLELEERGLASPSSRSLFDRVQATYFDGSQLRRLLQSNPGSSTLMALLLRCRRLGEQERLLRMLPKRGSRQHSTQAILLGVDVHLDRAETSQALRLFEGLTPEARRASASIGPGLRLVAALLEDSRTQSKANALMRQLLDQEDWVSQGLERGIDTLLADGHIDLAREALDQADSHGVPLESNLLLRWAWSGALAGNALQDTEALEALSRAEPYLGSGQADFARLLMDLDVGASGVDAARRLLNSQFANDEVRRALLLSIAGERAEALRITERLQAGLNTEQARWSALAPRVALAVRLVRAAELDPASDEGLPEWFTGADLPWFRGPTAEPAAMLLAAGDPQFAAWVLARQRGLDSPRSKSPLYAMLRALAWRSLGELERADAELMPHTQGAQASPSAWRLREELARQALTDRSLGSWSPRHQRLQELQLERLAQLGPLGDSAAAVALIRVRALRAEGRTEEAYLYLQKIREIWPEDANLRLEAARLAPVHGPESVAFALYEELFDRHGTAAQAVLPEVLDVLQEQLTKGQRSLESYRAQLQAFEALLPRDPSLPLLLAQLQLTRTESSSAWNAARALDRFARFRKRTTEHSLESLKPGSSAAWVRFLLVHDLEQAERLASAELDAHPEQVELWLQWIQTLAAGGQLGLARDVFDSIQSIFNDPGLEREHGLLLLGLGQPLPSDLLRSLKQRAEEDPEVALQLNLGTLIGRFSEEAKAEARSAILAAWAERESLGLNPARTSRLLLRTLGAQDEALGEVLEEALRETTLPQERSMLEILNQLQAFPVEDQANA